MIKTKLLPVLFIVSAAILVSGAMQSSTMAYPQQKQGYDAIYFDSPVRWFFKKIDAAQERAFPGAAATDQTNHLSFRYFDAYIFQHMQAAKVFVQVVYFNDRHVSGDQFVFHLAIPLGEA